MSRRPAVFNLYTSCQPEHGIGDDMSNHQAKLAVESRAYPLFTYDPDRGKTAAECFDLDGNPAIDRDWPVTKIDYVERGRQKEMELSTTFVDFAVTETRFRKHFRKVPRDAWHQDMVVVSDYLELDEDDREGKVPFVWAKRELSRLLVAEPMIKSAEERRDFWIMLRALADAEEAVEAAAASDEQMESRIRQEVVQKLTTGLMGLVSGDQSLDIAAVLSSGEAAAAAPDAPAAAPMAEASTAVAEAPAPAAAPAAVAGDYMAPWIDTEECTACDECIIINPQIFAYNDDKKAYIQSAEAGPYRDLVKSAEKCTAQVIHPGLPRDRSAKDIAKWIKRAQKFN
jgi:pyruvate-ferredoxin/flavodoxin oxidoreductase